MKSGTPNATDLAAYLVREYQPMVEQHGFLTGMKLQKLVYYCQAWSLAWEEGPVFPERIEAWVYGPVVRELFHLNKGQFQICEIPGGNPDRLTENQKETADVILECYGPMEPQIIAALAHEEDPWLKARERAGVGLYESSNEEILAEDMKEYYFNSQTQKAALA